MRKQKLLCLYQSIPYYYLCICEPVHIPDILAAHPDITPHDISNLLKGLLRYLFLCMKNAS